MRVTCGSCNRVFEAKSIKAKYCSDVCRKRAQRAPKVDVEPSVTPGTGPGPLETAAVAELTAASRLDTLTGQAVVALARKADHSGRESGSGLAAVVRELRATMGEALQGAPRAADALDELLQRRRARTGA